MSTTGDLTWTGPTSVRQCERTLLTWSGGAGPFRLRVTSGSGTSRQLGPSSGISGRSYSWLVDYPAGTRLTISVVPSLARYYPTVSVSVLSGSDDCTLYGAVRPATIRSSTTRTSATPAITRITITPPRTIATSTVFATAFTGTSSDEESTTEEETLQTSTTRDSLSLSSSEYERLKQSDFTSSDRTASISGSHQPSGSSTGGSDGGTTGTPGDNVGGGGGGGGSAGGSSRDIGAIVGGVVGGILGLALIGALLYAWLHARRRRRNEPTNVLDLEAETTEAMMEPESYPVTPYTPTVTASSDHTGIPEESPLLVTKEAPAPPDQTDEYAIDAGPVREQRPPQYDPNWSREQPKSF
ncbi:hypothetical protein A1Q2_06881 [Trichosporon asahii var. asahii CBS 8904]|uniref:Uncharacterized protein n=2 Tax=Trichosporon asahii var. asahii TaxID=189963 RepID=K1WAV3_TRIAC|nr:hypothetical protein A1Q1_00681 [Trichosporon asahii var. asahii CBS 2479]EJT52934.1 hypothetical protein A1Q1_00681 [Trichosporon asahii var. asahii CBS 2479]EKC98778.1 hypothetical protein A1Q2_06881 [Trichosporon asahii var. asahii CBS 8904]